MMCKRGFTLVELLIVVIMGFMLMAIGVSILGGGLIDGTRCKHGLLFSVDGNEQQMFGPNGPMECGK